MKQHITVEQLNELSEKGKEKLRQWVQSKDIFKRDYITPANKELLPLLSIGQMIEFLFDNDFGPIITSNDTAFYWIVEPEKKLDCWSKFEFSHAELCDALWEAVKEVLEK